MEVGKQIKEGLLTQNPVAVQYLGMCSALAITTSLFNGIGMGLCVIGVLTLSNVCISAVRKYIPDKIRLVCFAVIAATLVTVVDLLLQAYFSELAGNLEIFLPLMVMDGLLLDRAESYAGRNAVAASAIDGLCRGLGYALVLVVVSILREFLGKGSFGVGLLNGGKGIQVYPAEFAAGGMLLPVGGFLTLACVIAGVRYIRNRPKRSKKKEGVSKG